MADFPQAPIQADLNAPIPGQASVATPSPTNPQQPLAPLAPEEVRLWWARIELDRNRRKLESEKWKRQLRKYLPPSQTTDEDINSNIHFRNVHLKMAEVWAQFPELKLTPLGPLGNIPAIDPNTGTPVMDPQTQQPQILSADTLAAINRAVLNKELGRDCANADLMVLQALFDIFATSGIGATKICYQSDVTMIPAQTPGPPTTMPGAILGLQDVPGAPVMSESPVVTNERYLWYRFSTDKLGIPSDWHSTDYDAAPYLFMEFAERNTPAARKRYNLPDDFKGTASRDTRLISSQIEPNTAPAGNLELLEGVEVWLHAAEFDDTISNRDVFYRLVLIQGLRDKAAIYERSPYQDLTETGSLTPDSMIGNPIHPIVLRVASDMTWIPSDAAFTDPLVQLENVWINQDVALREANIPRFLHAASITTDIDKLKEAGNGQGVAVADDLMRAGIGALMVPLPHLERAQSDAQGFAHIQQANTETLGLGANQGGAYRSHGVTATEVATAQANVSVRLQSERTILLGRILQGVRKFASLIQRYMDAPGFVQIEGANGAKEWHAYTQAHLAPQFAYDATVDSQITLDQNSRIKRMTDFINFFAKSPFLNQAEALRLGAQEFGYDPSRMVQQPPPPAPPPPDKPKISISLQASDLAIPEVQLLLKQDGLDLTMQPISPELQAAHAAAQIKALPHGGGAAKVDQVDKHHSDQTGHQVGQQPLAGPPARPVTPPGSMVQ